MRFLGFFIFTFLSSWGWSSSISFEAKSYLPENKELYLEDIAVLAAGDDYALEALKTVKVADSAQDIENMSIQDIIRKIKPQLKVIERHCDCKLQIHIPKEVLEHSLMGYFSEEKLVSQLEHKIKNYCSECEVDIKDTNLLRGAIPENYNRWEAAIDVKTLKGAAMVRVYFDQNALNPVVYQMYVGLKKPVLKLRHPLPAGSQPQKEDVDVVLYEITHERRELASTQDLPNTELKRSLGAGELLSSGDLILRYKVKMGESIKVVIKNDSLEMEMSGVAQKQGRVGDRIPVRLAKTRKDVTGEILEDGRVAL